MTSGSATPLPKSTTPLAKATTSKCGTSGLHSLMVFMNMSDMKDCLVSTADMARSSSSCMYAISIMSGSVTWYTLPLNM